MRRYCALVVNVAALALSACSSYVCGPNTCLGGCCSTTGECVSPTNEACGTPGTACRACAANEQCTLGICTNPNRCESTAVQCQDESIMTLRLFTTANPDPITEEGTAPDFKSVIDARAQAVGTSPMTSYQYFKFTTTGLQKVTISDEQAFTSLDWDMALRRYIFRLNSGVSGPSCVEAARTAPGTMFDAVTTTPGGLTWRTETYFTPSAMCTFVDDGGLGGPAVALASYWTYQMCVQMTGNVYVIHLRDGRYVKLQVLSYYSPTVQPVCDSTGTAPTPNDAAIVRIRWGFIGAPG